MSQTMQDVINLQTSDAVAVATDQTTIAADAAKLNADQGQLGADQATEATDASNFASYLVTTGPVASLTPDNTSVVVYAAPGAVIPAGTPIPLASSVPVPTPSS
jgi:hypothetical protein